MSKSLGNYIGITDPPNEMYGKVMSISDTLMVRYYELLSTVDLERLQEIRDGKTHPLEAKKQLATELVARFHDNAAAVDAAEDFAQRFQRRELPTEIEAFTWGGEEQTVWICHLLRTTGLAKSTSEARRAIQQGGVRLDSTVVTDQDLQVVAKGETILQVGRRRVVKIVFPSASST